MHVEDHVRRCRERWGHTNPAFCKTVHEWIDAPYDSVILAPVHRLWRHWPHETPLEALSIFGPPAHECTVGHIADDRLSTGGTMQLFAAAVLVPVVTALALSGPRRR